MRRIITISIISLIFLSCSKTQSPTTSKIDLAKLVKTSEKGKFYFDTSISYKTTYDAVVKKLGEPKGNFPYLGSTFLNYESYAICIRKNNINDTKTWEIGGYMYSINPPIKVSDISAHFNTDIKITFEEGMDLPFATYTQNHVRYDFCSTDNFDFCDLIFIFRD